MTTLLAILEKAGEGLAGGSGARRRGVSGVELDAVDDVRGDDASWWSMDRP
jgi:hypothetical protein